MNCYVVHFKNTTTPVVINADGYDPVRKAGVYGFEFYKNDAQGKEIVGFTASAEIQSIVIEEE